ncbi:MAG: hypothetical protein IIC83_07880 [Chloroflexi bacterium]|nr:hypothetical protein [Chloroflexota bacterium]
MVGVGVDVNVLACSGALIRVDVGRAVCVLVGVAVNVGVGVDRASIVARTIASIVALASGVALGVSVGKDALTMAWTVPSISGVAVGAATGGLVPCTQPKRIMARGTATIIARNMPTFQKFSSQVRRNITINP